ncbi:MAG: molybdopterin molybdotransferase MoeA [Marivibrio sp.]|uniref:molybdopterin molybdotransferase MoeA n=1 Tax=Marivibrio sp. TaxID=2039719 RepID=UPI0032EAEEFD
MAQLTDDCFAFDGPLIETAEALARLKRSVGPIAPVETAATAAALGRVLAEDVAAPAPVPPYDNSAVDGYAVYADDLSAETETVLPVGGRVAAGHPLGRPQRRGEAVQIFTGAPMPAGADGGPGPDTVMMLEDCRLDGDRVALAPGLKRGSNRRDAGEDVAEGAVVLRAGKRLTPPDVGMLAACGRAEVRVFRPLTVALFSTGDEVAEPGGDLPAGALYDSNRFTIGAALQALGAEVLDLGVLHDRREGIEAAMREAAQRADAVLSTGGMSMGEEDHVRAGLERLGRLAFWRIAIKPGRPVGMGLLPDGRDGWTPVVGLPGNPVAALTTFIALARPLLQILQGETAAEPRRFPVRLDFAYKKKPGRREYVRVRLAEDPGGAGASDGALPVACKHGRGGAGMLSSLVGADGFVELAEDRTHVEAGEAAAFLSFSEVLR